MQRNRGKQKNGKDQRSRKLETPRDHFIRLGAIEDRNGMDLTEAEDIKKRWQEYREKKAYTEKLYQKRKKK